MLVGFFVIDNVQPRRAGQPQIVAPLADVQRRHRVKDVDPVWRRTVSA